MEEKRTRGRPKKAQLKLDIATELEKRRKRDDLQNLINALKKIEIKPIDGLTIIRDENYIKWYHSFKELINENPDIPQIIGLHPELGLFYRLYENYAGTSILMEEMLNIAMRKGIESIINKRKSKEKQDEVSAKTQKIHNRIVERYIEICTIKGGYPGNGYRALIVKKINGEFGKNTLTDPTYINKILNDARKDGKLDPNIGKRKPALRKNTSRK